MFWIVYQSLIDHLLNTDHEVALWFHQRLTQTFGNTLLWMSDPGCGGCVSSLTIGTGLILTWKRLWQKLLTLGMAVPGGMLVNEVMKETIRRPRPFQASQFAELTSYSFPSGHTMAATLIYGVIAVFALSAIKALHWRAATIFAAAVLVLMVAFSRVALGAHYMTDVVGAMIVSVCWLLISVRATEKMRGKGSAIPEPAPETSINI